MYRIFIDIPIESLALEEAISKSRRIMDILLDTNRNQDSFTHNISKMGITQLNYRLGDDEDRTPKNYFLIDDKGHAASKKSKVMLVKELDTDPV